MALLLFGFSILIKAGAPGHQGSLESADNIFKTGKFAEAEKLYALALAADPDNFQAIIRLGYIALLSERQNPKASFSYRLRERPPGGILPLAGQAGPRAGFDGLPRPAGGPERSRAMVPSRRDVCSVQDVLDKSEKIVAE